MNQNSGRGRGSRFVRNLDRPKVEQNVEKKQNHDGVCCQSVTINLDLDYHSNRFLSELKKLWIMLKKSPQVVNMIHQYYNSCDNCFEHAIRLMYNCHDFTNAKSKSLPFLLIEELKKYLSNLESPIGHLLTLQLKIDVLKLICKQNSLSFTKLIIEVYELQVSNQELLDIVKCLIDKKQFKEACFFSTLLNLHEHLTIFDFIVPMILQDKLFGIDEFLMGSRELQIKLVEWLDSILGNVSVRNALWEFVLMHKVDNVNVNKLHAKPLKRLLTRYMKDFKLPGELTPNLNKRRNEGAMQFLLNKKFIENGLSDDSWREMIQEAIGDDDDLKKELIASVCQYGEYNEALYWAEFYKLSKQDWPHVLIDLQDNSKTNPTPNQITNDENWDIPLTHKQTEYHKLALEFDKIHLIDKTETFSKFISQDLQDVDIVGIDCEWKPSFGNKSSEIALMQIATRKYVFILDIITLAKKTHNFWTDLARNLFNNSNILKLGFNFTSDMAILKQAIPEILFTHKQLGFLDLCSLWKQIENQSRVTLPFEAASGGPSLSVLVQKCFGKPLDKSDQFSNWEKRPLRENQLIYAALDAFCLIEVYDLLKVRCDASNYPFEDVCYNIMTNTKAPKKKAKKTGSKEVREVKPQPKSPFVNEIGSHEVKFVCSSMLQGLAKNLRRCGVDTVALENNDDHMECVRLAMEENRYILTRGANFNKLSGYVPPGFCLRIKSMDVDEQLKEVLDYFKIRVTKNDIFARCQTCNGNSFVKLSRETIKYLIGKGQTQLVPADYCKDAAGFSTDDDEDDFDEEPSPSQSRKWDVLTDEKINLNLCQTRLGAVIQVKTIPDTVIDKNDFFYTCEGCGKVYWDGSHFNKVLSGRLQGIVSF